MERVRVGNAAKRLGVHADTVCGCASCTRRARWAALEELLSDFMSLVSTFAGRMYGIRGREAKARLAGAGGERGPDPDGGDGALPGAARSGGCHREVLTARAVAQRVVRERGRGSTEGSVRRRSFASRIWTSPWGPGRAQEGRWVRRPYTLTDTKKV